MPCPPWGQLPAMLCPWGQLPAMPVRLGQLPAMPCAEAGTAVAATHAPKTKVASDRNVTLLDKLADLYLLHSGCAEAAKPVVLHH